MKKVVTIFVLFLYLIPAIGVSVNAHYCGGKLHSVNIGYDAKNSCGCKGSMKKNCCSNKTQVLKIDDDQQAAFKVNITPEIFKLLVTTLTFTQIFTFQSNGTTLFISDSSPPLSLSDSLFLLNRVFRI